MEQIEVSEDFTAVITSVRACVTWRHAFLDAAEKPNPEIGPQMCGSFRGLADLISDALLARITDLAGFFVEVNRMKKLVSVLELAVIDLKEGKRQIDQKEWMKILTKMNSKLKEITALLRKTEEIWSCCPSEDCAKDWSIISGQETSPEIARIENADPKYSELMTKLKNGIDATERVGKSLDSVLQGSDYYMKTTNLEDCILQVETVQSLKEDIGSLASVSASSFSPSFFDSGLIKALALFDDVSKGVLDLKLSLEKVPSPVDVTRSCTSGVKAMKLAIQKSLKHLEKKDLVKGIPDYFAFLSSLVTDLKLENLNTHLHTVLNVVRSGLDQKQTKKLASFVAHAKLVYGFCESVGTNTLSDLSHFSHIYADLMDMFSKLLKEGIVDPIPEEVEGDSTGPTKFTEMDQAGLGEGEGSKDVTDEIEDTSQIEDVKGQEKNEEEPKEAGMEDVEKPIEMDDDFNADLEDLNLEEGEDSSESDDNEGGDEAADPDWNKGEAEEPEEEQLDPNLWDTEQNNEELDDFNDGGNKETTEELTAKDNDAKPLEDSKEESEDIEEEIEDSEKVEETEEKQDDMENVDMRDIEEMGGDEEESTAGSDGEEVEETEEKLDEEQEAQLDEEIEEEKKVDDTSDTTSAAKCQSGTGQSEDTAADNAGDKNDKVEEDVEKEMRDEKQETETGGDMREDPHVGLPEDNHKRSADQAELEKKVDGNTKRWKSNIEKTLGDAEKNWKSDMNMREMNDSSEKNQLDEQSANQNWMLWSHEPNLDNSASQVLDSATLEEAQKQQLGEIANDKEEIAEETQDMNSGNSKEKNKSEDNAKFMADETDVQNLETDVQMESEMGIDEVIERSKDSTIHTVLDFYAHASHSLKYEVLPQFAMGTSQTDSNDTRSQSLWSTLQNLVQPLAAELSENLRLTLEPTQASKMEGDFRSGKRLNIRKLIPYVASNYRKDRIWLRRTKKAKRNYQVLIAVDDSSSMQDNKTRQLAYESLALLGLSLRYLEVGQVGICKFGGEPEMLYPMSSHFSEEAGVSVIGKLNFDQQKTNISKLLEFSVSSFLDSGRSSGGGGPNQLLLIVSDGRGLFVEGMEKGVIHKRRHLLSFDA